MQSIIVRVVCQPLSSSRRLFNTSAYIRLRYSSLGVGPEAFCLHWLSCLPSHCMVHETECTGWPCWVAYVAKQVCHFLRNNFYHFLHPNKRHWPIDRHSKISNTTATDITKHTSRFCLSSGVTIGRHSTPTYGSEGCGLSELFKCCSSEPGFGDIDICFCC